MWVPHIKNKVYICKRSTLKKYVTTRSTAHITIYNKHKHNHHYSHDTSSSLQLKFVTSSKLISANGSYWYGRIPVAIFSFFRKCIRSFVHWNCRSNNANGSRLVFDFMAPSKLSAKTRAIRRLQRLFPLPILPWDIGPVLRFISI